MRHVVYTRGMLDFFLSNMNEQFFMESTVGVFFFCLRTKYYLGPYFWTYKSQVLTHVHNYFIKTEFFIYFF